MSDHNSQVLDAAKRSRILAIVAGGSSRRVAARFVGCAPSTVTRTAARDPRFAADLARAEKTLEVEVLASLRQEIPEAPRERALDKLTSLLLECDDPPSPIPTTPSPNA